MSNRPKLELEPGQQATLRLLKDQPFIGSTARGKYYLYSVVDLGDNVEKAFFAEEGIHQILSDKKFLAGAEFQLAKVGTNGKAKLEISFVGNGTPAPSTNGKKDEFKEIMQHCIEDAVEITKTIRDIPWQNEDVRAISSCLFIARTKNGCH